MKSIKRITSAIVALSTALSVVAINAATVTDLKWYTGKDSETGLRHISLFAKVEGDDVTGYGVELDGVKYDAQTELSKDGGFGIQFFNVAKGKTYIAKTYVETANGTVYGEEQQLAYRGPGYATDDFSGAVITPATVTNAEWFDGYGWIDENDEVVAYKDLVWTKGTFTSTSAAGLTYTLSDPAYLGLSVENGGLLLTPEKGSSYAGNMVVDVNFEPITSGIAEITFKYDAKRYMGTDGGADFGMIYGGGKVIGGLAIRSRNAGCIAYKTGAAQAARVNVDSAFTDLNNVHTVKYIVDMTNSDVDIYIDDTLVVENQAFVNASGVIDKISFVSNDGSNPAANSPSFWFDDITVISE